MEENVLGDEVNFLYKNRQTDWFPNPLVRSTSSHSKFLINRTENSNLDKLKNISCFLKKERIYHKIYSKNSGFHLSPSF